MVQLVLTVSCLMQFEWLLYHWITDEVKAFKTVWCILASVQLNCISLDRSMLSTLLLDELVTGFSTMYSYILTGLGRLTSYHMIFISWSLVSNRKTYLALRSYLFAICMVQRKRLDWCVIVFVVCHIHAYNTYTCTLTYMWVHVFPNYLEVET